MNPLAIFVAGPPATGKSQFSNILSKKYKFPILSKDQIKEVLFDQLGIKDRLWSRNLGAAAMSLISTLSLENAQCGYSFIVESNFRPDSFKELVDSIKNKNDYSIIVINLFCKRHVLLDRFENRFKTGNRHPGHFDSITLKELESNLDSFGNCALEEGDFVFNIDTTDNFEFAEVYKCLDQLV